MVADSPSANSTTDTGTHPFSDISQLSVVGFTCKNTRSEFLTVFEFFVNLFWRGEGFNYMLVPFKFGSFNNVCSVFSSE